MLERVGGIWSLVARRDVVTDVALSTTGQYNATGLGPVHYTGMRTIPQSAPGSGDVQSTEQCIVVDVQSPEWAIRETNTSRGSALEWPV